MTKEVLRVKVYGEIALVTGRGKNSARWQGEDIEADEWVTDVYKKEKNTWLCVLTHLTRVKKAGAGNPCKFVSICSYEASPKMATERATQRGASAHRQQGPGVPAGRRDPDQGSGNT